MVPDCLTLQGVKQACSFFCPPGKAALSRHVGLLHLHGPNGLEQVHDFFYLPFHIFLKKLVKFKIILFEYLRFRGSPFPSSLLIHRCHYHETCLESISPHEETQLFLKQIYLHFNPLK